MEIVPGVQKNKKLIPVAVYYSASTQGSNNNPHEREITDNICRQFGPRGLIHVSGGNGKPDSHMATGCRAAHESGSPTLVISERHLATVQRENVNPLVEVGFYADNMQSRKHMFISASRYHVVLAGGLGTFDEMMTVLFSILYGRKDIQLIIYNENGMNQEYVHLIDAAIGRGDIPRSIRNNITYVKSSDELFKFIAEKEERPDILNPRKDRISPQEFKQRVSEMRDFSLSMAQAGQLKVQRRPESDKFFYNLSFHKDDVPQKLQDTAKRTVALWADGFSFINVSREQAVEEFLKRAAQHKLGVVINGENGPLTRYIVKAVKNSGVDHTIIVPESLKEVASGRIIQEALYDPNSLTAFNSLHAILQMTRQAVVLGDSIGALGTLGALQTLVDTRGADYKVISFDSKTSEQFLAERTYEKQYVSVRALQTLAQCGENIGRLLNWADIIHGRATRLANSTHHMWVDPDAGHCIKAKVITAQQAAQQARPRQRVA